METVRVAPEFTSLAPSHLSRPTRFGWHSPQSGHTSAQQRLDLEEKALRPKGFGAPARPDRHFTGTSSAVDRRLHGGTAATAEVTGPDDTTIRTSAHRWIRLPGAGWHRQALGMPRST